MAGRDRTCGAPRFRRALYRLSYGHEMEPAPPSIPHEGRSTQKRALPDGVVGATRPPFDPGSAKSPSYVEGSWSPSLVTLFREIGRPKRHAFFSAGVEGLSLSGGALIRFVGISS